MKTVAATELKSNLSALLGDVERGEVVAITRHGRTIARLVPENAEQQRARVKNAMEAMEKLRKSHPPTGLTIEEIIEMRHEGHRY